MYHTTVLNTVKGSLPLPSSLFFVKLNVLVTMPIVLRLLYRMQLKILGIEVVLKYIDCKVQHYFKYYIMCHLALLILLLSCVI